MAKGESGMHERVVRGAGFDEEGISGINMTTQVNPS
jgi:hypothetical protein